MRERRRGGSRLGPAKFTPHGMQVDALKSHFLSVGPETSRSWSLKFWWRAGIGNKCGYQVQGVDGQLCRPGAKSLELKV